jgi:hypothetical protein
LREQEKEAADKCGDFKKRRAIIEFKKKFQELLPAQSKAAYLEAAAPQLCTEVVTTWPAPGFEDTELGVFMEPEVGHGETKIYARVQA